MCNEQTNAHLVKSLLYCSSFIPIINCQSSVHLFVHYTGRFISPSGISDLCGTVAGMVTPMGSMSTEGETLQVCVLPYRCSKCPFCCVCLGCCAAEFGSSGGTYELPCTYGKRKQGTKVKIIRMETVITPPPPLPSKHLPVHY
jgi:MoaA/NifB/PqqE/SkfB family radical SAM enzyme